MGLFRRKKNEEEEVQTVERDALEMDAGEEDAPEAADTGENGTPSGEQATAVRATVDDPGGGSFIPEGGARVDPEAADGSSEDVSGETASNIEDAAQRAEERRGDVGGTATPAGAPEDGESPREAQRKGEGLPQPEIPGGRATAIHATAPTTQAAPDPGGAPRQSPLGAQVAAEQGADRPEIAVAGAFLGGIVLARLIAWMGDDDD